MLQWIEGVKEQLAGPCGALRQRVFVMDGAQLCARPGPLLVDTMQTMADILGASGSVAGCATHGRYWQQLQL